MRKLITVIAVVMIAAGCWYAITVFQEYRDGQKLYEDITDQFTLPVAGENMEEAMGQGSKEKEVQESGDNRKTQEELPPEDAPERMEVDWTGLKVVNTDVVAWIQLPAIDISYPVVQGNDNSYYLHRSITKEELFSGCLFMDSYNDPDLQNFNTIIYGHNMRDGSMFAKLKEYDNAETWTACPYFWIYTEQGDHLYRIFSSHKAEVNGSTFTVRFSDIKSYVSWLQKMKDSSSVASELDLAYGDKVVTLSTCTSGGGVRQILQGVLVYQSW